MTITALSGPGRSTVHSRSRTKPNALRRTLVTTIPVSALPRVSSTIVVTAVTLASLAPSLLPRSALTQALFTGVLAAIGFGSSSSPAACGTSSPVRAATTLRGTRCVCWC